VKIYVSRGRTVYLISTSVTRLSTSSTDTPEPQSIMTTKHDAIARFIHVIKPLGQIYKLPLTSLHIFYDQSGEMIAFNRNASIFLNLRYYEAWRKSFILLSTLVIRLIQPCRIDDADICAGNLKSAYISWYVWLTPNYLPDT